MFLTFIGAIGTVTGSKTLVEAGRGRFLVDCGLFQGPREVRSRNWDPFPVDPEGESIDVSALFSYKLNWQSVLFFGYQEASAWSPLTTDLEPAGRSLFLKVSYAFQR